MNDSNLVIEGGEDEGALVLLLDYILCRTRPMESTPVRLIVGRLPETLPVPLPIPDGARIIGTRLHSHVTSIFFTIDESEQGVLTFYHARLTAEGWLDAPRLDRQGGFIHTFPQTQHYELSPYGPRLGVNVSPRAGEWTDVALHLNTDPTAGQRQVDLQARLAERQRMDTLLPPLHPPPGAEQRPHGGHGGEGFLTRHATLITSLDPGAVESIYATQLQRAGWLRTDKGQSSLVVWSIWTFRDAERGEDWQGVLVIARYSEADMKYVLHLQVDKVTTN